MGLYDLDHNVSIDVDFNNNMSKINADVLQVQHM